MYEASTGPGWYFRSRGCTLLGPPLRSDPREGTAHPTRLMTPSMTVRCRHVKKRIFRFFFKFNFCTKKVRDPGDLDTAPLTVSFPCCTLLGPPLCSGPREDTTRPTRLIIFLEKMLIFKNIFDILWIFTLFLIWISNYYKMWFKKNE